MKLEFIIWQIKNYPKEGEKTFHLKERIALDSKQLEEIIAKHWLEENETFADLVENRYEADLQNGIVNE